MGPSAKTFHLKTMLIMKRKPVQQNPRQCALFHNFYPGREKLEVVTLKTIFSRLYSTNATLFDGFLAICSMKCFLSEPEALADFLRRGSANASGSKS
jgi:hypothetical protein